MRIRIPLIGITLHWGSKDGGPESTVFMYGVEAKWACSTLVLRFEDGSRDAFHSHAFNALSWVLGGLLTEFTAQRSCTYFPDWRPIFTSRECTHKVVSRGRTWVLSLRGPWQKTWTDIDGPTGVATVLQHGRTAARAAVVA